MRIWRDPQILRGYIVERPFDDLPLVTHCGEALCAPGHHLEPHRHSGFELLLLTAGEASWLADRRRFTQRPGDLFIAFPGQLHRTGGRSPRENQHVWVGLDLASLGKRGQDIARKLRRKKHQLITGFGEAEPLLRGIICQASSGRAGRGEVAKAYAEALVALLSQRLAPRQGEAPIAPCSLPIQRCIAYMEQEVTRRIPLQELAGIAAMRNVTYFCSRFRRESGMSPSALHLHFRLRAARAALQRADQTVTAVAHEFGFFSSQHFSGAFRAHFGVTPKDWRANWNVRS